MWTKLHIAKAMVFPVFHLQILELDHKKGWVTKNWCFQIVVLKTLKSPLDSKEIKPVNPKGNQPWIIFAKTDAEAEAQILWPSDVKSWLIGKNLDGGKDWRQKEKRVQKMRWWDSITNSTDMNLSKFQEILKDRGAWHSAVHGVAKWTEVKVTQSSPTLCYPMDYTVHGILQARILEWVAVSFSRGYSQPRDRTQVSCIAGGYFTS